MKAVYLIGRFLTQFRFQDTLDKGHTKNLEPLLINKLSSYVQQICFSYFTVSEELPFFLVCNFPQLLLLLLQLLMTRSRTRLQSPSKHWHCAETCQGFHDKVSSVPKTWHLDIFIVLGISLVHCTGTDRI